MKTDYVVKRIYPSGAVATLTHHSNAEDAELEAKTRHNREKKKEFAVSCITEKEIYRISPEFD